MRSSRKNVLFRGLAVTAMAAPLLFGCNESSPTEPKVFAVATPTPLPPGGGNIAGTWTGTYVSTDWLDCDTSIVSPALATISQTGSDVRGTMTATGDPNGCPCGNVTFRGALHGNLLVGPVESPGFPEGTWTVSGSLSGSTLDIALLNVYGNIFGQVHLHR